MLWTAAIPTNEHNPMYNILVSYRHIHASVAYGYLNNFKFSFQPRGVTMSSNVENTPEESIEALIDMLPSWDDKGWEEPLYKIVIRVDYVKSELKARLIDGAVKI